MADSKCCPDWNINLDYEGVACRCCGATLTTEHYCGRASAENRLPEDSTAECPACRRKDCCGPHKHPILGGSGKRLRRYCEWCRKKLGEDGGPNHDKTCPDRPKRK
jgi:hypothetical protein